VQWPLQCRLRLNHSRGCVSRSCEEWHRQLLTIIGSSWFPFCRPWFPHWCCCEQHWQIPPRGNTHGHTIARTLLERQSRVRNWLLRRLEQAANYDSPTTLLILYLTILVP
jgi:hypothetical protein